MRAIVQDRYGAPEDLRTLSWRNGGAYAEYAAVWQDALAPASMSAASWI